MDDHISPTRRRWFQFRLRGLLVAVTLLALFMGWLGWELKFVRERTTAIKWVRDNGGTCVMASDWRALAPPGSPLVKSFPTVPFWRRWMGDEAVIILFPKDYATDWAEHLEWDKLFLRLFPEAVGYLREHGDV